MTRLLLLRHATCTVPAGHCLGQWDLPLDAAGERAVADLRRRWTGPPPRRVYCSDLDRARRTAEILLAGSGPPPIPDARLREISHGDWEGRAWDAIHRESPAALRHWGRHWLDSAPPGGESGAALFERVGQWYRECAAGEPGPVLVVAHAGSLRALACVLGGRGPEELFDMAFEYCAPVTMNGRGVLVE